MRLRLQVTWLLLAAGCVPSSDSAVSREPLTGVATLTVARSKVIATLLPSGLVLLTGGTDQTDGLSTAELFDPQTGALRAAPPMPSPHFFHTATLLRSGEVLVLSGKDTFLSSTSAVTSFDPRTETWTALPPLAAERERHTTTVLNDGRLLVAGSRSGVLGAQLRERDGGFTPTGPMLLRRGEHSASRLADGRVLVVGGFNDPSMVVTATTEGFDPATNSWTDAGTMPIPARYNHAAVPLADGRLLIAGGSGPLRSSGPLASAAIYQPLDGGWTVVPSMNQARTLPSGTLLPNGKVLVFGNGSTLVPGEVFDPLDGGWTPLSPPSAGLRDEHAATILPTGEVLIAGGANSVGLIGLVEIYDPATPSWRGAGPLPSSKARHTLTLLPSGRVLAAGGTLSPGEAALFDPSTDTWTPTGALQTARAGHTATLLRGGKVLLAGGDANGVPVAACELFDPATGLFTTTAPMASARVGHRATLLASGQVLVTGGRATQGGPALASAELYDPQLGAWRSTASPMTRGRDQHFATLLQDGRVLLVGDSPEVDLYEPLGDRFTAGPATNVAHPGPSGALLPSGRVFLAGGATTVEELDLDGGAWTAVGSLPVARQRIAVLAMPGGKVLLSGGLTSSGTPSSAVELYDPRARALLTLPPRPDARVDHAVTRLLDGRALVSGGLTLFGLVATSETFADGLAPIPQLEPVLAGPLPETRPGARLALSGSGFLRPGSQGLYNESEASFPLLRLERLDNLDARYAPTSEWSATSATAELPATLQPGWHLARVIVNGATSQGVPLLIAFPEVDAGVPDGGVTDAGVTDAGMTDAGMTDAGMTDAGEPDAGVDGGSPDGGLDPAKALRVGCGCGADAGAPFVLALALSLLRFARSGRRARAERDLVEQR